MARIPLFFLGIGFDAKMDFMSDVADRSNGYAAHITDDYEVSEQMEFFQRHLNDVVLKNLRLQYIGNVVSDLTRQQFKLFHQGGSVVVAGSISAPGATELEVEAAGQSAKGLYMDLPGVFKLRDKGCRGNMTLCAQPNLEGRCVAVDMSRSNLKELGFGNRASSIRVQGDCYWTAYAEPYYGGVNVTLGPETDYPALEDMDKTISSVRQLPEEVKAQDAVKDKKEIPHKGNSVARLWAYIKIMDVMDRFEVRPESVGRRELAFATKLALRFHYLTPFTDLELVHHTKDEEPTADPTQNYTPTLISYSNLNPVSSSEPDRLFSKLESCTPPVECEGKFHFEKIGSENDTASCQGSRIVLFTEPDFGGDSIAVSVDLFQLYHDEYSQRMRSLVTEAANDSCCWLVFDRRFFAGQPTERICGSFEQRRRKKNVGSIKRMNG